MFDNGCIAKTARSLKSRIFDKAVEKAIRKNLITNEDDINWVYVNSTTISVTNNDFEL